MLRLVARRLLQALLTLLVASFLIFMLARLTGNPADLLLPIEATTAERDALLQSLGLDKPVLVQYGIFLEDALRGDFGTSVRSRRPVTELVGDRLTNSLILSTVVLVETILIGVPLGVMAAIHRNRGWDRFALAMSLFGQAMPTFWTGLLAINLFAVTLHWLPTSGMRDWQSLVLPSLTTAWAISAGLVRLVRSSMLEVLDTEYVRTARAKGLRESAVMVRHALPNALVTVITFIGMTYGLIVGASISIEVVFSWPGLGRLTYDAVTSRDFPVLQFGVLAWTAIVLAISLVVDLMYSIVDPRITL